ncbi:MAG: response regulator [Ignavibacteriaceae bacterium]|nr:response regulator [Ignavibacteriaceae bacterium]
MPGKNVLLLFRNQANITVMSDVLVKNGYRVLSASTYNDYDSLIEKSGDPVSVILADISGFDENIWRRFQRAKDLSIPLLVISPRENLTMQKESISHGARGIMSKPLAVAELLKVLSELTL